MHGAQLKKTSRRLGQCPRWVTKEMQEARPCPAVLAADEHEALKNHRMLAAVARDCVASTPKPVLGKRPQTTGPAPRQLQALDAAFDGSAHRAASTCAKRKPQHPGHPTQARVQLDPCDRMDTAKWPHIVQAVAIFSLCLVPPLCTTTTYRLASTQTSTQPSLCTVTLWLPWPPQSRVCLVPWRQHGAQWQARLGLRLTHAREQWKPGDPLSTMPPTHWMLVGW